MKLSKIALLLIVAFVFLTFVTACRCEPQSEKWYLASCVKNCTFMGGVEREFGFSKASVIYPLASADFSKTYIDFKDDGSLIFSTWEGEELKGTYSYSHTANYTNVYLAFESGETGVANAMESIQGEKKLVFVFQDVKYTFTPEKITNGPTLDEIIDNVASGEANSLYKSFVEKSDGGYIVRFSDIIYYTIAEQTAVVAIRIEADGGYVILDELYEGEVLSTYNENAGYVVIYYIEK